MATSQESGGPNGATFRSHRVLPYQPQPVFEAFARPELLAHWWGPNGFTNTFEVFEFRPGGRWKFVMHGRASCSRSRWLRMQLEPRSLGPRSSRTARLLPASGTSSSQPTSRI